VVLIGTAHYDDADFWELKQVSNNLTALRDLLTQPGRGGFQPGHCHLISNPSDVKGLDDHILDIAREAKDVLLIYYSGHGMVDLQERQLYLCLAATDSARLYYSALAIRRIKAAFLASTAKIKVLILDCCYSGKIGSEIFMTSEASILSQQIDVGGVYALSSAPAYDVSVAEPDAEYTAFTGALLELLGNGVPGDASTLTLASLYPHLKKALVDKNYPEPQQWIQATAGELVLVRNGAMALSDQSPQVAVTVPQPEYGGAGRDRVGGTDHEGQPAFQLRRIAHGSDALLAGGDESGITAEHEDRLCELIEHARQADKAGGPDVDPDAVVTELRQIVTDMISLTRPEHSEVLAARDLLAFWLGRAGNRKGAARMYERLAAARECSLGADHEAVMATRHNQAHWTGGAGDPESAVALFDRVVADRRRVLGEEHPDTLLSLEGLAYWKGEAGDATGAAGLYRGLADQLEWQNGDMDDAVLQARYYLADSTGKAGVPDEAAEIYEDLAIRWDAKLAPGCPNSIACREKGVYWRQRGRHAEGQDVQIGDSRHQGAGGRDAG
jgi:hypothetical protein